MSEPRVILITGKPGVGKTTLLENIYNEYNGKVKVGGVLTREVRQKGVRIGFRIRDLGSDREGWLAQTNGSTGPRIGRYSVHTGDLDNIGAHAIETALEDASVRLVLVDEIGPMETTSNRFKDSIGRLFEQSAKPVLATYKAGTDYPILESVLRDASTVRFEVHIENREILFKRASNLLNEWLLGESRA